MCLCLDHLVNFSKQKSIHTAKRLEWQAETFFQSRQKEWEWVNEWDWIKYQIISFFLPSICRKNHFFLWELTTIQNLNLINKVGHCRRYIDLSRSNQWDKKSGKMREMRGEKKRDEKLWLRAYPKCVKNLNLPHSLLMMSMIKIHHKWIIFSRIAFSIFFCPLRLTRQ